MTKQADYGIVLMTYFALDRQRRVCNARDLAQRARLPQPTVTKILKALARGGLLVSQRGINGGYRLVREPEEISVGEVVAALEGPIAITQCCENGAGCDQEAFCPVRSNWQLIDRAVRGALDGVTLAQMAQPMPLQQMNAMEKRVRSATREAMEERSPGSEPRVERVVGALSSGASGASDG